MRLRWMLVLILVLGVCLPAWGEGLQGSADVALVGGQIYPGPGVKPIEGGSVLIREGRIVAVGAKVRVPRGVRVIDCRGMVVTAGFWNSHVHILLPGLLHAEKRTGAELTGELEQMLTRWGFTTVFDIASVLENTNLIRRRIASGEVTGPRILTVGEPFWMKGGTPVYVEDFLKQNDVRIPEVESAAQGEARVRQQVKDGADGIKIFANSIESDGVLTMPLELAKAIAAEAHRAAKPVFAHVSNDAGVEVARQAGVDVMAHVAFQGGPWSADYAKRLVAAHMALIPTLTLMDVETSRSNASPEEVEKGMRYAAQKLGEFSRAGGQVLFGTDVGYTQHFDTAEEFVWMGKAGMRFDEVLAAVTTSPAERFGEAARRGRVAKGMEGDVVVLGGDPARDLAAFSRVKYTVRGGRVLYTAK